MLKPAFKKRQFLKENIDLTDLAVLETVFADLKTALEKAETVEDLKSWIEKDHELSAAIGQVFAEAYIAMTCHTDDEEKEKAYLYLEQKVSPWLKQKGIVISRALKAHSAFAHLPEEYAIYKRGVETGIDLFKEENIARETREAELGQEYEKVMGSMTVQFDGKEQTLTRLARVQQEIDRDRREAAWKAGVECKKEKSAELAENFELHFQERMAQAKALNRSFVDLIFEEKERDYTPEYCLRFHEAIEAEAVPLLREIQEWRRQDLGLERLRPWDMAVDPQQQEPLVPFKTTEELLDKMSAIMGKVDPRGRVKTHFDGMRKDALLDLDNRKGKAPGAYHCSLSESGASFIFANAVGVQSDVETLAHEDGHALHFSEGREQPIGAYREAPMEFKEVASMSMEQFVSFYYTEMYSSADARRARRELLEGIVFALPSIALGDAFQHAIYSEEALKQTPEERKQARDRLWLGLKKRFGGIVDWSGHEEALASSWHQIGHFFTTPFYYIEYGIAQLGALQFGLKYKGDPLRTMDNYFYALSLGGSKKVPELFEAGEIKFDCSREMIQKLMNGVREELIFLRQADAAEKGLPPIKAPVKEVTTLEQVASDLQRTIPLPANQPVAGVAPIAGTRQV